MVVSKTKHSKTKTEARIFEFSVLRFRDFGASRSSFRCLVFEIWVLRFRDLGASFSRFGCFVFEIWVLRFRDLGASCFGLRFRVLRFRNYRDSIGSALVRLLVMVLAELGTLGSVFELSVQ